MQASAGKANSRFGVRRGFRFLGYRVVPAPAPWMAAGKPFDPQPAATHDAEALHGPGEIMRTSRLKPTPAARPDQGGKQGGDAPLVRANHGDHDPFAHGCVSVRVQVDPAAWPGRAVRGWRPAGQAAAILPANPHEWRGQPGSGRSPPARGRRASPGANGARCHAAAAVRDCGRRRCQHGGR